MRVGCVLPVITVSLQNVSIWINVTFVTNNGKCGMAGSPHDTDLSNFLPYLLFQAGELTSLNFQAHYRSRYGMLRTEWRVLFHLGSKGGQTAKQICDSAMLHKTKVSRAVNALEAKRFLSRQKVENDLRSEVLLLTKQGQKTFSDLVIVASDYNRTFERTLGERDQATLVATLQKLIAIGKTG